MKFLTNHVWGVIISPQVRNLKSQFEIYLHQHEIIEFKLYEASNETKKSSYCAKYYLARSVSKKQESIEKRKLLIVFPGREFFSVQIGNTFYARHLFKTDKLENYDIATIIYPKKNRNIFQLAESCRLAIEDLLGPKHGYHISNVSILGSCLGGYFATETLRRFFEANSSLCDDTFECFINNKSFSSVRDFLEYVCGMPNLMKHFLKIWPISLYVRKWNSDIAKSLESINENFKYVYIVYSNGDNVVKGLAHLYKHINQQIRNVEIREDMERMNHLCNWKLFAEILEIETQITNGTHL